MIFKVKYFPMKKYIITISLAFIGIFCFQFLSSQYKIELKIPGMDNDTILFGHYFNESISLKDTFFMNDGTAIIQGEEELPEGMYTLYFRDKKRLDLLIDKDQQFQISTDPDDLLNKTRFKGSEQNRIFYDYLEYLAKKRNDIRPLQEKMAAVSDENDSLFLVNEINMINEEVKEYVNGVIQNNEGTLLSKFLLAMKDIEVPEPPKDEEGNVIDPNFRAKYYKNHYFDYFDISDVRLLRTPVYANKIKTYLDKWVYPSPDSIYEEVDFLIEKSRSDSLLFKYMLTTLFNYYAKSKYVGMDAIYAYIGEKYYLPEATWSSDEFKEKLRERIEKINPLMIGKKAPDAQLVYVPDDHFKAAAEDTAVKSNPYIGDFFNIHDIDANFTILYFWEADCGHCKETIPKLYELYNELKNKGLKVVAINMLGGVEGKEKWVDFINEHHLYGWINAWNPYDYTYRETYDITSSNILYLFDKDLKIIAKRISPEQVKSIILQEFDKSDGF